MINKVIRASAGTGKTYRLSLEYISLLLQNREAGIHFSEILVITFTKKATAEIRDRIFHHLQTVDENSADAASLRRNLAEIAGFPLTKAHLHYLKQIHQEMLTEKSRVQISTIDAFTNQIFKTVIAPSVGLTDYTIDPQAYQEYLDELYAYILGPDHLPKIRRLLERSAHRNIKSYEKLIKQILDKRWIFPFIAGRHLPVDSGLAEKSLQRFQALFLQVHERLTPLLREKCPTGPPHSLLKKAFYEAIAETGARDLQAWDRQLRERIADRTFLSKQSGLFLAGDAFWNGVRILNGARYAELKTELVQALQTAGLHLAEYLYHTEFLQEQEDLQEISRLLLTKYDEILFREKRFNYSDVLYHTYQHLHDPGLSLMHGDEVSNTFYEILTTRIRFLLIDEFQDTSILQFKLLLPIIKEITSGEGVKPYGGIIVVGDEKQSIYSWRGGERDFILRMPQLIPDLQQLQLTTSYRHSPTVMRFINSVFSDPALTEELEKQKMRWPYQECRTEQTREGSVTILLHNEADGDEPASSLSAAEDFIHRLLNPLLEQRCIHPGRTAVLARFNRDLDKLARCLDDQGIDYVLNSSRSIFEHRAIKPLFYLFAFLVRQDVVELAKFLRSDLVRIDGPALKQVLQCYQRHVQTPGTAGSFIQALRQECSHLPGVAGVVDLAESGAAFDLFDYCLAAVTACKVPAVFPLEADLVNINFFLELVAGFSQRHRTYPATLQGLIRFAEEHREDENYQQAGLEEIDAINLLTIHKSKGLEFDSVLLYWEVQPRAHQETNALHDYLAYTDDYSTARDFALTYNLDHLLPYTSHGELAASDRNKKNIEELNTLYVAMTRAKQNLFIYCSYEKKDGLEAYLHSMDDASEATASKLLFKTMMNKMKQEQGWKVLDDRTHQVQIGVVAAPKIDLSETRKDDPPFSAEIWDPERRGLLQRDPLKSEREAYIDFKSMYIKKRNLDRGTVVHYYLSQLVRGTQEEKSRARSGTVSRYGSLLPPAEVLRLLDQVDRQLSEQHAYLFFDRWKVFTERTIFSPEGKELRIDRLLVDDEDQQILIVDFKTGEQYDEGQMHAYVEAVAALPVVQQGRYTVRGEFIEIKLELE
ncbi:MAG TPA: UvrD-helicase domain-containing protein [bacterium]|nr:UvrD-helicase domain-containing protein [bacterium]HPN34390.1 UvrD-helicase domain-containing protein [bacterium]